MMEHVSFWHCFSKNLQSFSINEKSVQIQSMDSNLSERIIKAFCKYLIMIMFNLWINDRVREWQINEIKAWACKEVYAFRINRFGCFLDICDWIHLIPRNFRNINWFKVAIEFLFKLLFFHKFCLIEVLSILGDFFFA